MDKEAKKPEQALPADGEDAAAEERRFINTKENSHLKWAFSEAAVLFLRNNPAGKKLQQRLVSRYGKAKALSLNAQKLDRTVSYMLKRKEPFSPQKFYKDSVHAPVA